VATDEVIGVKVLLPYTGFSVTPELPN